jgi:hypothetical protein
LKEALREEEVVAVLGVQAYETFYTASSKKQN